MLVVVRDWQSTISKEMREQMHDLVAILSVVFGVLAQLVECAFLEQVDEYEVARLVGAKMHGELRKTRRFTLDKPAG